MSEVKEIKLEKIVLSKDNPRKEFPRNSLEELAASIKQNGLVQAIKVRPKGKLFELVFGERRLKAHKLLKLKTIRAEIENLTDEQVKIIRLVENLNREDIHPLDEAKSIQDLLDDPKLSLEAVADKLGKTKAYVAGRLQLTKLVPEVHKKYAAGDLELGHALLLAKLQPNDQKTLLEEELDGRYGYTTVRELKKIIQNNLMLNLHEAPFGVKDKLLFDTAGSCAACLKRTGNALDLFSEFSGKNICTDPVCFNEKVRLHIEQKLARAEEEGVHMVKLVHAYNGNKAEGIYGSGHYDEFSPKDDKALKPLVKKGIYIDNPNRGKIKDIILKEDKAKMEKSVEGDNKNTKPEKRTDKQKLDKENEVIQRNRNILFTKKIGEAILEQKLLNNILIPLAKRIYENDGLYNNYFGFPDKIKGDDLKKMNDTQFIVLFNTAAIKEAMKPDTDYDDNFLIEVAERFQIDHKAISKAIEKELPLLTMAQLKETLKTE